MQFEKGLNLAILAVSAVQGFEGYVEFANSVFRCQRQSADVPSSLFVYENVDGLISIGEFRIERVQDGCT